MELTTPLASLKEKDEMVFTLTFQVGKLTILEISYVPLIKTLKLEIFNLALTHIFLPKAKV